MTDQAFRAPSECPVCAHELRVARLSCPGCGAELAGDFAPCSFCRLDDAQLRTLHVFLASRGNLREVAKHLGVSYPTARARLTELLVALGLSGDADAPPLTREQVLAAVADGSLTPQQAEPLLVGATGDTTA